MQAEYTVMADRIAKALKAGGAPVRLILRPSMKDGNFVQPTKVGPERELIEQHNRDRFAAHFKFTDPYTGLTRTYDEQGRYNCGRCNQADDQECLLVNENGDPIDPLEISREAGSCGDWENLCAGDPEMPLYQKSADVAVYGVAKDGIGFGCHKCGYASAAFEPDSRGRELYCGRGDFRTFGTACCAQNNAPTI